MKPLSREEYVEQGFFFATVANRLERGESLQDVMVHVREEVLADAPPDGDRLSSLSRTQSPGCDGA
ncbi:MAG: hypothetical protein R3B96_03970 [Pirellulaceae bacterium]